MEVLLIIILILVVIIANLKVNLNVANIKKDYWRELAIKSNNKLKNIEPINNNPPEQNTTKPAKNKGGRPKDPKIAKLRKLLYLDYYSLTEKDGYKKSKALDLLEKKYSWKRLTIEKYLKGVN